MSLQDIQFKIATSLDGSGLDAASRRVSSFSGALNKTSSAAQIFSKTLGDEFGAAAGAAGMLGNILSNFIKGGIWGAGAAVAVEGFKMIAGTVTAAWEEAARLAKETAEAGRALAKLYQGERATQITQLRAAETGAIALHDLFVEFDAEKIQQDLLRLLSSISAPARHIGQAVKNRGD